MLSEETLILDWGTLHPFVPLASTDIVLSPAPRPDDSHNVLSLHVKCIFRKANTHPHIHRKQSSQQEAHVAV